MSNDKLYFEKVTLLITHYNRSTSLERLLAGFANLNCSFFEIIVSDDASQPEHLEYIDQLKSKYEFTLVTTPKNKGLGNNLNKGQDAVRSEHTLYVQEDFVPLAVFPVHFQNALKIFEEDKSIDTIRFYSYLNYPKQIPYKDGFTEMIFDPWSLDVVKVAMYSDHPHLRRKNFLEKFGRYDETKKSDHAEYDMMVSFLKNKGKGLLFADYKSVFDQVNTSSEPSTVKRNSLRNSGNFFIAAIRQLYRLLKFNYIYFLKK